MEEDSCAHDLGFKDSRNLRGGVSDPKKRLNHKESAQRSKQISKRDQQRESQGENSEAIKAEYDEINEEYQNMLIKKRKQEQEAKKLQEKQEMIQKDFIDNAFGPEPKNERKKQYYQEKLESFNSSKQVKAKPVASAQRSALLTYLQSTFK